MIFSSNAYRPFFPSILPLSIKSKHIVAYSSFPSPRIFSYETIKSNISISDAIPAVKKAFSALGNNQVDVPHPMHISIDESGNTGPGHCHIKGGYVLGTSTFSVKLATLGFIKNSS